ncbi:hypothetical protein BB561_005621 [Smittium simulii]|uniref:Uncharacterized protein n=1 Tax=Smittium simulii TaxID=133385 RepID=A0A2T9Y9H4_9FUNG|nr:hypothetical protein BB561_005621 [Smittium simulii]
MGIKRVDNNNIETNIFNEHVLDTLFTCGFSTLKTGIFDKIKQSEKKNISKFYNFGVAANNTAKSETISKLKQI